MTTTTNQYQAAELWVDTVGVRSVDVDWDIVGGECREGFTSYEAPECPTCGEYAKPEGYNWICENEECEDEGSEIEDEYSEGPMMNYHYPLPDLRRVGDDPREAAYLIRDLPLCVVEFADGSYSLALTGGGMDLSWEICEAFTRLGWLPPLHFCDLPRMAGYDNQYLVKACLRSCEVAEHQAQSTRERLVHFLAEEGS